MDIIINGHTVCTPLIEIVTAMTGEKATISERAGDNYVKSEYGNGQVCTTIVHDGRTITETQQVQPNQRLIDEVKGAYYNTACRFYGKTLPWGMLTGIRPAKIARNLLDIGETNIEEKLKQLYFFSPKKAKLALQVAAKEKQILDKMTDKNSVGIYISIPFCPTRCLYCSFVSLPISKSGVYITPYLGKLACEIAYTGDLLRKNGISVNSIYIGGGTPGVLDAAQTDALLNAVSRAFLQEKQVEFTFEAGRADVITYEKLQTIKRYPVTRLCINPQSLNDQTLQTIGRSHSAADFAAVFNMAKKMGFDNINADVIAGLPGETADLFIRSLGQLVEMRPGSVTVHAMCKKRAADLTMDQWQRETDNAQSMVSRGYDLLCGADYAPYYMYRQKQTVGNLENTAFSLNGKECFYNVMMMEDTGSVVGLGAGAVSKIVHPGMQSQRVYNHKDPHEYIKNFDAELEKKRTVFEKIAAV